MFCMHLRHEEAVQQRTEGPHPDDLAGSKLEREGLSAVAAAVKLHRGRLSQRTVGVSCRGWSTRQFSSSSNLFHCDNTSCVREDLHLFAVREGARVMHGHIVTCRNSKFHAPHCT